MDPNNNYPQLSMNPDEEGLEYLTTENVEEELKRLKLIRDDYAFDDEIRYKDKVRLTGNGLDFKALKAGQDIEFQFDPDNLEEAQDFDEDNEKVKVDYETLFKHRNTDVLLPSDEEETVDESGEPRTKSESTKMPFEILRDKMVDISPLKDGSVMKRVLIPGAGLLIPTASRVRVHYNAYFEMNDEPFDSTHLRNKSFEFKLGADEVIMGFDVALATMKKHEKSQFIFEPTYYMGRLGCEPRVPKDTPVLFEIEVVSFIEANEYEKFEQSSDEQRAKLSLSHMLRICNCLRELGNDNYRRHEYNDASKKYRKAKYLLENTSVSSEEDEKRWKSVMLKLNLNMSQISLKQVKPKKTIYYCKMALDIDEHNVKALFRYGYSLRMLQNFDRARVYLHKALKIDSTNKEIIEEICKLDDAVAKYRMVEKEIYQKMFGLGGTSKDKDCGYKLELNQKQNTDDQIKESLIENLNDFVANPDMKVYKIQMQIYSEEINNFAISEAKARNLVVREYSRETNVLHIMKSV